MTKLNLKIMLFIFCFIANNIAFANPNIHNLSTKNSSSLPIILAKKLNHLKDIEISQYYISEKLDGIRAYWNGKNLLTRKNNIINAPDKFTQILPKNICLDGELWLGRGKFSETQSLISNKNINNKNWDNLHYMIFDLPQNHSTFDEKYKFILTIVKNINDSHVQAVEQHNFTSANQVMDFYNKIIKNNGEGIMFRHKTATYSIGKSENLLKLKPFDEAEALVIGYKPGKGKYKDKIGSLKVKMQEKIFYIGSGLTDLERSEPPKIGSMISFTCSGFSKRGIPRHPRFSHVHKDLSNY